MSSFVTLVRHRPWVPSRRAFLGAAAASLLPVPPGAGEYAEACGVVVAPADAGACHWELRLLWARINSVELAARWTEHLRTRDAVVTLACECAAATSATAPLRDGALVICAGTLVRRSGTYVLRVDAVDEAT